MITHLGEVCRIACNNALYEKEIRIASLMHDFGKYTLYFQEYLDTGNETALSRHGFISAVDSALAVYSCVMHHHGNLRSIGHNLPQRRGVISKLHDANLVGKIEISSLQLEDIKKNIDIISSEYNDFGYGQLISEFITSADIESLLIELKKTELKEKPNYIKHQYIYSRLIYADEIYFSTGNKCFKHYIAS